LQWFSILWQTSHKEKDGDNGYENDNKKLKRNVSTVVWELGRKKFIDDEGEKK
jgi:hypothetical protein